MDLKERYLTLLKSIREILKNENQMHISSIKKKMDIILEDCIKLENEISKEKEWEVGGSGLTEEDKQEINNSLLELKSKIDNQDKKIDENSSQIDEIEKQEVRTATLEKAVEDKVQEKIDDGSMAALTIADETLEKKKLTQALQTEITTNTSNLKAIENNIGYEKREYINRLYGLVDNYYNVNITPVNANGTNILYTTTENNMKLPYDKYLLYITIENTGNINASFSIQFRDINSGGAPLNIINAIQNQSLDIEMKKTFICEVNTTEFNGGRQVIKIIPNGSYPNGYFTIKITAIALISINENPNTDYILNILKNNGYPNNIIEEYSNINNKLENIEKNIKTITSKYKSKITFIGDSIGNQICGQIKNNNFTNEVEVINACSGGETVLDTLGKKGIYPYFVLPFTIPASGQSSEIDIVHGLFLKTDFNSETGAPKWSNGYYSNYSSTGINPYDKLECSINNIEGTLYFARTHTTNYFVRKTDGEEITLDRPYPVIPLNPLDRDTAVICFMGTNGGWDSRFIQGITEKGTATKEDADFLVNLYKYIVDWIRPVNNDYLFLGFYATASVDQVNAETRIKWWDYFERRMTEEFGYHYLSIRKYLRERAYKDVGISLIDTDIYNINEGRIPYVASTGDINQVHLTTNMCKAVTNQIFKRLKELNIIEDYIKNDIDGSNESGSTNPDDYN